MLVDGCEEDRRSDDVVASALGDDAALDVMKSNDDTDAADDVTEIPDSPECGRTTVELLKVTGGAWCDMKLKSNGSAACTPISRPSGTYLIFPLFAFTAAGSGSAVA